MSHLISQRKYSVAEREVEVASATRKAEIRDTALDLFTRHGYEATTMGDIAGVMGIRGPSLYKHVSSKQVLLAEIMTATMDALWAAHTSAVSSTGDSVEQLRRAVEAHVRFHARHRQEAFVGNREIRSLAEPARTSVLEIDISAARGLILRACWELDRARGAGLEVSVAKTFTSEAVWRVVDRSLQLCGSLGVSGDILLGRFLREVRPFRIYDGPSETHRWSIARRVVGRQNPAVRG